MKSFALLTSMVLSSVAFAHVDAPPHLDLEMSSSEYQAHLKKMSKSQKSKTSDHPAITYAIKMGERLSLWIASVNANRSPERAIRLTSPQTRRGIPIDKPSIYSPQTVEKDTAKVIAELPEGMKAVITSTDAVPSDIPVDDETFIKHARLLDKIYQNAARYKSVDQYRYYYIQAAAKDVRGYHYFTTNNITAEDLKEVSQIESEKVEPIKNALLQLCQNSGRTVSSCGRMVKEAFEKNEVAPLYSALYPIGKQLWDEFFVIPDYGVRSDIAWSGNVMTVPFNTPSIPKFIPYLQDNIEDEFRWEGWALKMNFGTFANGPRLIFERGVVPHVNGLGGNEIVMDSNQPIEEYESQWTIRHEFGHVLGLPDCYHEFYDMNLQAYVNYQLDITDLMCSRAGNMKERIYQELKKAYDK